MQTLLNNPKVTISLLGFMLSVFLFVAGSAFSSNHGLVGLVFTILAVICGLGIQEEANNIPKKRI